MNEIRIKQLLIARFAGEASLMKFGFKQLIHIGKLVEIMTVKANKVQKSK